MVALSRVSHPNFKQILHPWRIEASKNKEIERLKLWHLDKDQFFILDAFVFFHWPLFTILLNVCKSNTDKSPPILFKIGGLLPLHCFRNVKRSHMSSYVVRRCIFLFWMSFDSVRSGAITELCLYKEIVPIWNFDGYSKLSSRYFEWRNDEQVLNKYTILLFNKNFLRVLKIFYYVDKVISNSRLVVISSYEWKQGQKYYQKRNISEFARGNRYFPRYFAA